MQKVIIPSPPCHFRIDNIPLSYRWTF
jgi:hypothetical protein